MGKLIPKKKLLKKKSVLTKEQEKKFSRGIQEPFMVGKNLILNTGRMFFYGQSLNILANSGGFQYCRIHPDLSLSVRYHNRKTVKISPVILCSRNRMYNFKYIQAVSAGYDPNKIDLEFEMDEYDLELSKLLKGEKDARNGTSKG